MKTKILTTTLAAGLVCGGVSMVLADHVVNFRELPAPAQQTINAHRGRAEIASIEEIVHHGIPLYQVRLKEPGADKEFYVSETGTLINPELIGGSPSPGAIVGNRAPNVVSRGHSIDQLDKVTFDQLPRAVQRTILTQAGPAEIQNIDMASRNGQLEYQVAFKRGQRTVQMRLDQNGNVLSGAAPVAAAPRVPLAAATKVTFDQLPEAVQRTLREYSGGARIEDIDKGTLDGRNVYQAAFKYRGQNIELRVAENGAVLSDPVNNQYLAQIGRLPSQSAAAMGRGPSWQSWSDQGRSEEPLRSATKVTFDQLPPQVQKTVMAQVGTARIEDIDRGLLGGKTVYEVAFKRRGEHVEMRVAADGSILGSSTLENRISPR